MANLGLSISNEIMEMGVGYECKSEQEAQALDGWLKTNNYPNCDILNQDRSAGSLGNRMHVLVKCDKQESLWFFNIGCTSVKGSKDVTMCTSLQQVIERVRYRELIQKTADVPNEVNEVRPFATQVQNIKVSTDFSRKELFELGRVGPYNRFINYPVEITTEINDLYLSKEAMQDMMDWCKPSHEIITPKAFWNLSPKDCCAMARKMSDERFEEMLDYPLSETNDTYDYKGATDAIESYPIQNRI